MARTSKKSHKPNPKASMLHKTSSENIAKRKHKKHLKLSKAQLIYFVGIPITIILTVSSLAFAYNRYVNYTANTPKAESLKGGVVGDLDWGTEPTSNQATEPKTSASANKTTNQSTAGNSSMHDYYQKKADETAKELAELNKCISLNNQASSIYKFERDSADSNADSRIAAAKVDSHLTQDMKNAVTGFSWTRFNNAASQAYDDYVKAFKNTNCKPVSGPPALYNLAQFQISAMASYPNLENYPFD